MVGVGGLTHLAEVCHSLLGRKMAWPHMTIRTRKSTQMKARLLSFTLVPSGLQTTGHFLLQARQERADCSRRWHHHCRKFTRWLRASRFCMPWYNLMSSYNKIAVPIVEVKNISAVFSETFLPKKCQRVLSFQSLPADHCCASPETVYLHKSSGTLGMKDPIFTYYSSMTQHAGRRSGK